MSSILHILDGSCEETRLGLLETLVGRLDSCRHAICSIDAAGAARASRFLGRKVEVAPLRLGGVLHFAPGLREASRACGADVVHAWGVDAATSAAAMVRGKPLVLSLMNPAEARDAARWVRALPERVRVVVGGQTIRGKLVQAGLSAEQAVVVRGPADFGAIQRARQAAGGLRAFGRDGPVILLSGPATRGGGEFVGIWAAAIVAQIHRGLRVMMPYESKEAERLRRFVKQIGMEEMLVVPPVTWRWHELAVRADIFLMPALEDVCTEALGTVMAAGVVVVGSAVRSVAEIIADRSNGLLCKANEPRLLAARLMTALEDEGLRREVVETARGQAYEVFSVRGFLDHFGRVYANAIAGRAAGDGVRDMAMVG